jgi:hypothetical protein
MSQPPTPKPPPEVLRLVLERNGDHDDISAPGRVGDRSGAGLWSELGDERGQGFRPRELLIMTS